jgi:hypothetical protein
MRFDLSLRCECGCVRGVAREVSPSAGFRFICYCNDCQAFARFLDRPDVLDGAGGTDIYQMPPGRIALTAGTDALRCLRYSEKVLRWYTDCCRTPIGNTASGPRFPVVGLIHSFVSQALMSQAFMSQAFMSPEAPERAREEGAGFAPVSPLRTFRHRSVAGDCAAAPIVGDVRRPRIEAPRLVGVRARRAESILRHSHQRSAFRTARSCAERAIVAARRCREQKESR